MTEKRFVESADGTPIAYIRRGSGPALIQVDGALCYCEQGPSAALADQLEEQFTVYTYDRRGRGDSGDTGPYSVDKEIADLAALVEVAGGRACLYGISSGAVLALDAANRIDGIERLAVYEAPFIVDDTRPPLGDDYVEDLRRHLAAGKHSAAVRRFMRAVEVPAPMTFVMALMPVWKKLVAVAPTLLYDAAVMGDTQSGMPLPADRWSDVTMQTLVMAGGKSPGWMRNGQQALVSVLPNARHLTLDGQTHMLKAEAVAPVLVEFFSAG
ncbi:MAG TPA: alpha/beta hydrolase [Acidimicrobiia bacterium]|nr:alpha/beta hydrolase [Acidimicrobiia bacterium]